MNLNPFDLRGPDFLAFYAAVTVLTLYLVWWLRRRSEEGTPDAVAQLAQTTAEDPYQIAYLRGGRLELLRVAVVSLLERGLLKADGETLSAESADAADKARRPLDKMLLLKFAAPDKARALFGNTGVLAAARAVEGQLREKRLLPHSTISLRRFFLTVGALMLLWSLAGTKMAVALGRGHKNIGLLMFFAVVAMVALIVIVVRSRTVLGDQVCDDLKQRFEKLRSRRTGFHWGQTGSELTFLAAVYGLTLLPDAMDDALKALELYPTNSSASSGWSSCGSSSCGGGGGCGGGGCGGGCGGCGS